MLEVGAADEVDRQAILTVSKALSSVTDFDRLVKRAVSVIAQVSEATEVGLFLEQAFQLDGHHAEAPERVDPERRTDPSRWTLVAVARTGQPVMALRVSAAVSSDHGFSAELVGHAIGSLQAESIDDLANDDCLCPEIRGETRATAESKGSALLLPIHSKGRRWALLLLTHRRATGFFTPRLRNTMELVAAQFASALHGAMLRRSMQERASCRTHALRDTADELMLRDRALAAASEAVTILDATREDFAAVYVNPAFEAITGYQPGEVLGRSLFRLYGDDTAQPGIHALRAAVRRGVDHRVTVRCYRKNGEMFWNEVSVAPVVDADGRARHVVCINIDVTRRVEEAAAAKRRSERLEAVFELSPDGVVVLDADHRITSVNPAFGSMTGLAAAGLVGQPIGLLEAELAARSDGGGLPSWQSEQPVMVRLHRPQPRVLLRRIRRAADGWHGTVLYFRDITREAEIDRMKSDFLATAAHELRTPMTSVCGFTELLLNRRLHASLRIEMLEVIHRQTAALTSLVDELLDVARVEAGGQATFESTLQPLQPLIAQAVSRFDLLHGVPRVVMQMPAVAVLAEVDAARLAIALTNALSNAHRYSVDGPITVTLSGSCVSGETSIAVADRGIGMTPGQVARMFERFYRADHDYPVEGCGLGACIMKDIVQAHGGRVEVRSRLGEGTTVTLWLPGVAVAQRRARSGGSLA